MSYLSNLNFIVGKKEVSAGTAIALTSDDFDVRIVNPAITYNTEVDDEAAKYARGDHAEAESVFGARSAQVTFDIRVAYAGSDTAEPDFWKYLNACGLKSVTYTGNGIALQPLAAGDEVTMTIGFYQVSRGTSPTALCTILAGCMGNAVIMTEGIGKPWVARCTMTGKLVSVSTIANADIPYPTDMAQLHPEKFLNNTIYIDGKPVKVSQFSLDPGCEVQPVIDQSDRTGYSHFAIVNRKPRFSCNPLLLGLTDDDPIGDIISGCTGLYAVDRIVVKSNRYRICMPRTQMLPPSLAAREGLEAWDKSFKLMNNGYTGSLGDTGLPDECTFEVLIGLHETGMSGDTGMYL